MTTVNRVLIDSKHRQQESQSTSDFRVELPETITVGDNMACVNTDICIPVCWYTVEKDVNDMLFFRIVDSTSYKDYIMTLPSRNYNRTEVAETMKK